MLAERIERLLPRVQKPARYVGNEVNSIKKDWQQVQVTMAFAFPDVYEVGMSHLGLRILYHEVNKRQDALMERVFAPWTDLEELLRQEGLPLFSLESRRPLADFDLIGFTMQYELSFSNILNMLDLARLPLFSRERGEEHPLILAGGPCAFNPEPLADFIDAFVIGEGEEVIHEILDVVRDWKQAGRPGGRQEVLLRLARVPGVYVPAFYTVNYREDGSITSIGPNREGVPARVTRRLIRDLDSLDFPTAPIVPFLETVHDRIMLEVLRGCTRGCRFCQAGMIYRPVRERKPETLLRQAREAVRHTGYNEIALTSLSTADYSCVAPLLSTLINELGEEGVGVSLPSLRVDAFSVDLAQQIQRVRKTGLTFAPEAGTQRMRNIINKGVTEADLEAAVTAAFRAGWNQIKLYFMIGLPEEREEDVAGIAALAARVVEIGRREKTASRQVKVTVSVSSFVPKAHTPFQWVGQDSMENLQKKQELLKELVKKNKAITLNYHDARTSLIEAAFARGDRRLGAVLYTAWQQGCKFDGWSEHFRYETWREAFAAHGFTPEDFARRSFGREEILPWEHINCGVSKDFLWREYEQAIRQAVTPDCRWYGCKGCRLCPDLEVDNLLQGGERA